MATGFESSSDDAAATADTGRSATGTADATAVAAATANDAANYAFFASTSGRAFDA